MQAPHPLPDQDKRMRRVLYRANHRGTKELDLLMGQFARTLLANQIDGPPQEYSEDERLAVIEWLIAQPDHALQPWLIDGRTSPDDLPVLVRLALKGFEYQSAKIE